ncbi:hypothetical protein [Methylotenera sp.]|uniref:hypothetical protein n=1 Tax=Methylotenera sp. TaxID=2051956 RepID=UPI0025EEE1F8|nr:hypothetical protein [Methylotenera sp.]
MMKNLNTFTRHALAYTAIISLVGCASTTPPKYLPAPSAAKSAEDYQRQQIPSPVKKQMLSAFVSGFVSGALGPLGGFVSSYISKYSQQKILTGYWQSIANTEIVGVVIEDATQKRKQEYQANAKLFTNLPPEATMPQHLSVDFGSGHLLILPVTPSITPKQGDVVSAFIADDAWKMVGDPIDFKYMPRISSIRCVAADIACVKRPENEQGIAQRFNAAQMVKN